MKNTVHRPQVGKRRVTPQCGRTRVKPTAVRRHSPDDRLSCVTPPPRTPSGIGDNVSACETVVVHGPKKKNVKRQRKTANNEKPKKKPEKRATEFPDRVFELKHSDGRYKHNYR